MEKVLVAMSGGVDSSTAAYLLKKHGMAVEGVFFIFYDEPANLKFAQETIKFLNIPFHIQDLRSHFKTEVIEPFFEAYKRGLTPNPCIVCNRKIKFPALKNLADKINARYFSTGHYARILKIDNSYSLFKGVDSTKDQSYFLYGIKKDFLERILFPLGELTKQEVKKIAQQAGIPSAQAEESAEVCFLKDKRYYDFFKKSEEGPIIEISTGKILGHHRGIHLYTIGQRKRLGIPYSHPLYVVKIDPSLNTIYVSSKNKAFMREFYVEELNWLADYNEKEFSCEVKIRYAMKPEKAVVTIIDDNKAKVCFENPQFAPTPGQSAVFYRGDMVLGGGIITETVQDF